MKKSEKALQLIKELYETPYGGVGGYGHIVFDDGNVDDWNIDFCLREAERNTYSKDLPEETRQASIKALLKFKELPIRIRERVYDKFHSQNT